MNSDYWINLAAQWIQTRSANLPAIIFPAQMPHQIPFFEAQHQPMPQAPAPPKISMCDVTADDNHETTDMDLEEDEKEQEAEESPPPQQQQPWQQHSSGSTNWKSNHKPQNQMFPSAFQSSTPPTSFHHPSNHHRQNYHHQHQNESSQSVDMVLDSDNEENDSEAAAAAAMEIQRRKKLPLWIREALEKLEREKNLEKIRLQREDELEKEKEIRKKEMEEALRELEREKRQKQMESEEEEDDDYEQPPPPVIVNEDDDEVKQDSVQPEYDEDEDSEIVHEKMVTIVRKTLTEILLEVTDKMIQEISKETHSKMCKKASSVTSIRPSGLVNLGLGAYSDSSEDESEPEATEKVEDKTISIEPEYVIRDRIRVKSHSYSQRSREVKNKLAHLEELENKIFHSKPNESEPASRDQSEDEISEKLNNNKNHSISNDGETKYEKNSSNVGSFARQRDRKKSRFNDPSERSSTILVTHVGMLNALPPPPDPSTLHFPNALRTSSKDESLVEIKKDEKKSRRRSKSLSSTTSSSGKNKKHKKKHKKSGKHSKKSSRKKSRSRSRSSSRRRRSRSSDHRDRRSMDSKSSVRSSDSKRRSRSRSRDHHRSRRY